MNHTEIIEEIQKNGLITFDGNKDSFESWLNATIPALGHRKPIELMSTAEGAELVNSELLRIEHGIY